VSLASEIKYANLSCGNDSIYDDVTANVPAVVIAILEPLPTPHWSTAMFTEFNCRGFSFVKSTEATVTICKFLNFPTSFILPQAEVLNP
jgi:hypothetical protein